MILNDFQPTCVLIKLLINKTNKKKFKRNFENKNETHYSEHVYQGHFQTAIQVTK